MRNVTIFFAVLTASCASAAMASVPSYELVRTTADQDHTPQRYTVECNLKPGVAAQLTEIAGIKSSRTTSFASDDAGVQALVEAAPGIPVPDLSGTTSHTSWWVRSYPGDTARLVRINYTLADGENQILQDDSRAGTVLSTLIGINCTQVFGQ